MKKGKAHDSCFLDEADQYPRKGKYNKVMIRRLGQDCGMLMYPDRLQDTEKRGINAIIEREPPHPDLQAKGFTAKFTRRIFFGYEVDIFSPDGRQIAENARVRKGFSKEFQDPMNDGLMIELKLGVLGKDTLSLSVLCKIMMENEEDVKEAVKMIAGDWEKVDPIRLKSMMRNIPDFRPDAPDSSAKAFSSSANLYCELCSAFGKAAERGVSIADAVPSIARLLSDCDDDVRLNATFAFVMAATYGQDITAAIPSLKAARNDPCEDVRNNADITLILVDLMAGRIMLPK